MMVELANERFIVRERFFHMRHSRRNPAKLYRLGKALLPNAGNPSSKHGVFLRPPMNEISGRAKHR
jgi:hypothetical protein